MPTLDMDEYEAANLLIHAITAPIDAAIDAATGANRSVAARFIEWATREHWGVEHAPAAYRKKLADNEVQRA